MTYKRVLPRDLFNEAKLLKCLGAFCIAAEEYPAIQVDYTDTHCECFDCGAQFAGFGVNQDPSDGSLYAEQVSVTINGHAINLSTVYNSKGAYPMYATDGTETVEVFTGTGNFSEAFEAMIVRLMHNNNKK